VIGETLGHYRIRDRLGGGGMGEVFRAEDTQLGREVALKVLRPELVDSPERRQRFEREARTLAALNHPNIVTVYSVEQAGGRDFITMELVRGERLSRRIRKGGLPVSDLLELAIPLADALAAAHDQGITHRDLKPDNVMVGPEGGVKVLDFGLAKLRPQGPGLVDSQFATGTMTTEGQIVGTVAYMSPEQAQGRPVDHRSDIFSLGVVLYEMATGERPFRGETASALLAAIQKDTPASVTELRPELPRELGRILRRALAKDPEERIQTAKELRHELRELKVEVDSGEAWERPRPVRARRRWALVAGLAIVAVAAGAAIWRLVSRQPAAEPLTVTPITSDPAEEASPALSPDGKLVAYVRPREGGADLYVKQIGGGEPIRVARRVVGEIAWTPDGGEIASSRRLTVAGTGDANEIFVVAALGGAERQLTTALTSNDGLSWSPDGRLLAMTDKESPEDPDGIFLFSRETGEKRRLTKPPPESLLGDRSPRFSPDGRILAFVRATDIPQSDIYLVPIEGGEPQRLTSGNRHTAGLDWTPDARGIVFSSSRSPRAGFLALWRVSASGGEPKPLEFGEEGKSPTLSRQGHHLAYVKRQWDSDIWRVGGPTARGGDGAAMRFISSSWFDFDPVYSPDGSRVLITSSRSGHSEIWVCDSDGANPRQLTFLGALTIGGSWSPDGRRISFMSPKEGSQDLYVVDSAGGIPRRLTTDRWDDVDPKWSRDARWIYFSSNRSGRRELWKMPAGGGDAVQVTRNGATGHAESPDGRSVYFTKSGPEGGPPGLWRMPVGGGAEVQVLGQVRFCDWTVFERGICYLNREAEPGPAIELFEFGSGQVSRVAVLEEQPSPWGLSVSPDGRWILYVREESTSDLMLVENFR
jgi:Tol biopolymer transport system component/predicted Ser/Thr protein kinase